MDPKIVGYYKDYQKGAPNLWKPPYGIQKRVQSRALGLESEGSGREYGFQGRTGAS